MSQQTSPLTYEGILELFRQSREELREVKAMFQETDRKFQETDRKFQETREQMVAETDRIVKENAEQMKVQMAESDQKFEETRKQIGGLGTRVGQIVENMIYGDIVAQFQDLGYEVTACSQNKRFGIKGTKESGEIDLLLEDGDVVILIEAKTTLKIDEVHEHIERMGKYRQWMDARGTSDKMRLIGAVAGTVVAENVVKFAHENGLYVIVQSARDVEILPLPEGFVAKEW